MANQKSQIYPIQLQGAELNLNKFDGEIKQYSGFNKNNSPFVGGCLSNIFTKKETISNATPENTFIDTNGDIYKLTADGLFRNNSKVLNSAKTINRTEIAKDETLVKVFTENGIDNFCLYYRNGVFYLNDYQLDVGLDSYLPEERIYYCCDGFFDTLNDTDCFIFTCIGTSGLRLYIFDIWRPNSPLSNTLLLDSKSPKTSDYILPTTFFHNAGSSNVLLFCETRRPQPYYEHWLYYFQLKINSDFSVTFRRNRFELDDLQNSLKLRYGGSTPTGIASLYFYDYILQGCPTNRIVARHTRDGTALYLKYQFFIDSDVNSYDNTDGLSLVIWDVDPSVRIESSYVRSSDLNNKYLNEAYKEEWLCLKQIASVLFQVIDINDVTYTSGVNCSNIISLVSKSVEDQVRVRAKSAMGYMCTLGDNNPFVLLINNGNISGIGTRNGVLITAWNEIEPNSIFFTNTTITYKEGNTFYFIAETLASSNLYRFKKVNNQIVTNFDSVNNSYDIVSQSAKLYAPSYNAALSTEVISFTQSDTNNYLCAASVNEYALENNCSILLNPQLCFFNDRTKGYLTPPSYVTNGAGFAYAVNIYLGKDECLYYRTVKQANNFLNRKLYNLPFPSDTDGNVQYSPSLFSEVKDIYGNMLFVKSSNSFYPLMLYNNKPVMSFYLASGIDEVSEGFVIQGQFYVIINNNLYSASYANGVTTDVTFIVSVQGLKFCGNTPYQAFFFSKTNRCLYIFNGANLLQKSQFVDKFSDILAYRYNSATHSIFMITSSNVIVFSIFGTYQLDISDVIEVFTLDEGVCFLTDIGEFIYIKYYKKYINNGFTKQNIQLETCFYGMNNEVVTVNDCLYFRIFSEEHDQGDLEVSATTLSLEGRKTEKTTFKIKESDWDKMTHTIYLRYQPKEQRGLGISFSINSPFKIASLSVGSQPDAVLIDKVSKGAINAPQQTSNNDEW